MSNLAQCAGFPFGIETTAQPAVGVIRQSCIQKRGRAITEFILFLRSRGWTRTIGAESGKDRTMIEPSDTERASWPDATREYVEALETADDAARQIIATERGEVMKLRKEVERLKDQASRMNWERPTIEQMQAQVAAAYEDASGHALIDRTMDEPPLFKDGARWHGLHTSTAIKGRTPADASAALDALLHQARIEGAKAMREEAANWCRMHIMGTPYLNTTAQFSNYVADPVDEETLRRSQLSHHGMGYAEAIHEIDPEQVVKRDD